jgi:hypothetical protein
MTIPPMRRLCRPLQICAPQATTGTLSWSGMRLIPRQRRDMSSIALSTAQTFLRSGSSYPAFIASRTFLASPAFVRDIGVIASDRRNRQSAPSEIASASTRELTDDELLTMLQHACFHYYWEGADPNSGMPSGAVQWPKVKIRSGSK